MLTSCLVDSMTQRVESLTKQHPSHLIILAGIPSAPSALKPTLSAAHAHSRRQHFLQTTSTAPTATVTATPINTKGGIFSKYQLFTPTLLTALLIFVLIRIPIVFVGLNALSSIQVPRIGSIVKPVGAEKKNQ